MNHRILLFDVHDTFVQNAHRACAERELELEVAGTSGQGLELAWMK